MEPDKMCIQCEHLKEHCLSHGCWGRRYVCSLNPTWSLIGKPMVHYCGHWEKSKALILVEKQNLSKTLAKIDLSELEAAAHRACLPHLQYAKISWDKSEDKESLWKELFKSIRFNKR